MCCFLPVHSWHSSLPFSFFDCDFFFLPCFNSEAKGPQPAKSHRSSLAKPQKAWLPLLSALSLSHSPCTTTVCVPLSFSLDVSLRCHVSPVCLVPFCYIFVSVRIGQSAALSQFSISLFFFLCPFPTHTHTHHPVYFPVRQSVIASGLVSQAGFSWAPQTHGSQSAFLCVLEWYFFCYAVHALYLIFF